MTEAGTQPTFQGLLAIEPELARYKAEAIEAAKNGVADWVTWIQRYAGFDRLFHAGQPAAGPGHKAVAVDALAAIHRRAMRTRGK